MRGPVRPLNDRFVRCMRIAVGLILAELLFGCGSTGERLGVSRSRIVGGRDAEDGSWPNVVWLDVGCTGIVVHRNLVLYAAHCGSNVGFVWTGEAVNLDDDSLETLSSDGTRVPVERCEAYEGASIARGNDIAYCVLVEPIETSIVPIVAECERHRATSNGFATLVGYGSDEPTGAAAGTKRYVDANVGAGAGEIQIGDADRGTCAGDSGGPAFVSVAVNGVAEPDLRVLGLLSSGEIDSCGHGWYVDLQRFVGWLEERTQFDLSPCTNSDGQWQPTVRCMRSGLDATGKEVGGPPIAIDTCGPPANLSRVEDGPPALDLVELVWDREARRLSVEVSAYGADIEYVAFTPVAADRGTQLKKSRDEIAPYALDVSLPPGVEPTYVETTVMAFSGRSTVIEWPVERSGGGSQCAVANHGGFRRSHHYEGWIAMLGVSALRRRMRRPLDSASGINRDRNRLRG